MQDPRKQFLVGVREAGAGGAPLEAFLIEVSGLAGANPSAMRDPRYAVVQLTESEAATLREKYRDSSIIEPDAPLSY